MIMIAKVTKEQFGECILRFDMAVWEELVLPYIKGHTVEEILAMYVEADVLFADVLDELGIEWREE